MRKVLPVLAVAGLWLAVVAAGPTPHPSASPSLDPTPVPSATPVPTPPPTETPSPSPTVDTGAAGGGTGGGQHPASALSAFLLSPFGIIVILLLLAALGTSIYFIWRSRRQAGPGRPGGPAGAVRP